MSSAAALQDVLKAGIAEMMGSMNSVEQRLGGKMDSLERVVSGNTAGLSELRMKVTESTSTLQNLEERVTRGEERFEERVTGLIKKQLTDAGFCPDISSSDLPIRSLSSLENSFGAKADRQSSAYWKCRRSLRMWPVRGPDLIQSVLMFLEDKLKFDHDFLQNDIGPLRVERFIDPRSKVSNEVLNSAIRDAVKGSGRHLAGQGRLAGLRMEVPHHLKSDFRVLELSLIHI